MSGSAAASAMCSSRIVGSTIGWARPDVYSSSPKSTKLWPVPESTWLLREQSGLRGQGAADEEAAQEPAAGRRLGASR